METIIIAAICLSVLIVIILGFFLIYSLKKKRVLRKLAEKYGKPSTRAYDERDFTNISQLFTLFPAKGKETVDDITWNDLQMPLVYQQMNHSVSHIGDEFLHRHIRTQRYDELDRLEKHIQYFDAHPKERLNLQYAFHNINPKTRVEQTRASYLTENKKKCVDFVAHMKDTDLFPNISIIPSAVILISAILLIVFVLCIPILSFVNVQALIVILVLSMFFVISGSAIYFELFMKKIHDYIPTIKTFCAGVNASAQIAKLDPNVFGKELQLLIPVIKKLRNKSRDMNALIDICMLQNEMAAGLGIITLIFGLYGFVYQWAVKTIKRFTAEAMISYESIGYVELCIGLGSYRKTISNYCHPEFSENSQVAFDELYHPLLKDPVTNSKTLNHKLIITGANASGKSTFIKTLAINAITAQSINLCYAKRFSLQPAYIYTAMNLSDDITTGDSFYMAEIKRLKGFLDSLGKASYKMYFVDEILKGTNTIERIAAASSVLRRFAESNCFFCLATHDTELTSILQHYYSNYHFEETTTDTEIFYDYKLYDGVTPGSNAIALLRVMQYDESIVDGASKSAQYYISNSKWEIFPK